MPVGVLPGTAAGQGYATWQRGQMHRPALVGLTLYAQWFVDDPAAVGGMVRSNAVAVTLF